MDAKAAMRAASAIPIAGKGEGKILVVCDHPDMRAFKAAEPLSGGVASAFQTCLHMAGLISHDIIVYNFLYDEVRLGKYWNEKANKKGPNQLVGNLKKYTETLIQIVETYKPKLIISMGELPTFALLGKASLMKYRGYLFKSPIVNQIVIPTLPVAKTIFSNYIWRFYIAHDFNKAQRFIESGCKIPELTLVIPESLAEIDAIMDELGERSHVTFDIEVANYEVSCISFCTEESLKANRAYSIPIDMRWSIQEEVAIWNMIAALLENPNISKGGQNLIFDIHFLAQKMGIFVRGAIKDTMIAHSIMFPDFLKRLEFLGSIYSLQPHWKDMMDWKNIKKES
ncbi:MAG: hypothetical protein ACRD4B_10185 [Acidobacteriota bacterium]